MKDSVRKNVTIGPGERLVISAEYEEGNGIAVFRLTPNACLLADSSAKDIYVAVPRGRRVTVSNIPEGSYSLRRLEGDL